jgi:altronate dehydratase
VIRLEDVARLPLPEDNAAIACRRLEAGTEIDLGEGTFCLAHTVLEGHRFAVSPIEAGAQVRSWGKPFGHARRRIDPAEYLCNAAMLEALQIRSGDFRLPHKPNFTDADLHFQFDPAGFHSGKSLALYPQAGTFQGFARPGGRRGTGTRNFIVLLGASSLAASFARALEARLKGLSEPYPNVDGIVSVAHTEGGESRAPNNLDLVLRTLAGFIVHPNVGAVLVIDQGGEAANNRALEVFLCSHDYPVDDVLLEFRSIGEDLEASLDDCAALVRDWLEPVNRFSRLERPLSDLKVALQCGGSDAFSGVSGNPLAAGAARELIRHGGVAVLAETDELIGAEDYILDNTRDLATAREFLDCIERFEERAAWHGQSVRDNPTGGNKFRGLYNITLKSLGAARKKDPSVCLEQVIDYSQRITASGYHFMDSPGNDLESTAGQVAAGCNLIFFITGNGAITNFPFVPTIKIITTTSRWELMPGDMDVNAGRYLDGESMEDLTAETFGLAVETASGSLSAGERAGHSQVSIWRNWRQTDRSRLGLLQSAPSPDGIPVPIVTGPPCAERYQAWKVQNGHAIERMGLIVPTSLCSGQIANRIAAQLNEGLDRREEGISRHVALVHTEGCGASSGDNEAIYLRTLASYLVHPCVAQALLLEHGCEHTHNDMFRQVLKERGIDPDRFGYASIQMDGGIEKVSARVQDWFAQRGDQGLEGQREEVDLGSMALGLATSGRPSAWMATALAETVRMIVSSGGSVVIPSTDRMVQARAFLDQMGISKQPAPTLAYGQPIEHRGLHIMETPGDHLVEAMSGMGATGVQLMLVYTPGQPAQTHPMVPVLQVAEFDGAPPAYPWLDHLVQTGKSGIDEAAKELVGLVCRTASGAWEPQLRSAGYSDFQITRGQLGVSL